MAIRLRDIIAPHEVRDPAKLAALVAAYQAGAAVPPVVVIDWTGTDDHDGAPPSALSGSHRLAALCEVHEGDTAADSLGVVVLSGADLIDDLAGLAEGDGTTARAAEYALDELAALADDGGVDLSRLCEVLISTGVLPAEAASALEGQ